MQTKRENEAERAPWKKLNKKHKKISSRKCCKSDVIIS